MRNRQPTPDQTLRQTRNPPLDSEGPTRDAKSDGDDVKPFHAKKTSSGQEAADVVAAVLQHAKERDAAAKKKVVAKKQTKWMLPLGVNLGVLASYLLIFSPSWIELSPIGPPPVENQVENLRAAMFLQISRIEGFRITNGRYPQTLAEAGVSAEEVDYNLQGDSAYVLISSVGTETVVFDSSTDDPTVWAGNLAARIGG